MRGSILHKKDRQKVVSAWFQMIEIGRKSLVC